jgi:uncharacterized membrane protein
MYQTRITLIDIARGAALAGMTIFHFCWDLTMFGLADPALMTGAGMIWFGRVIAGSFLFLAGFSLVLAHGDGIRWRKFVIRLTMIAGAALAITVVTLIATPDAFIFFGILHAIALGSILGLALLRLPWWLAAALAAVFLVGRHWLSTPGFDSPWLWWTGLSSASPRSNDFVPMFPFFGMVVAGIAGGKLISRLNLLGDLAQVSLRGRLSELLQLIGRHSLLYYLLHQPVLIALLGGYLRLTGRI